MCVNIQLAYKYKQHLKTGVPLQLLDCDHISLSMEQCFCRLNKKYYCSLYMHVIIYVTELQHFVYFIIQDSHRSTNQMTLQLKTLVLIILSCCMFYAQNYSHHHHLCLISLHFPLLGLDVI